MSSPNPVFVNLQTPSGVNSVAADRGHIHNLHSGVLEVSSGNISLLGLPTSSAGLASGRLWRNGTAINIVP
jgi:hypothetical protein